MLDGTVSVVTGASQGIGARIAAAHARSGADVAVLARSEDGLRATADEVAQAGRRALVCPADVTSEVQLADAASKIAAEFGRVDTVVANSGVAGPSGPVWELEAAALRETLEVNVTGTFLTIRAFLPMLLERRAGSIIVIGSMTGKRPLAGRSPYAASKAALIGLVRTVAHEAGPHGVRVNLVSPGAVEGPRIRWVLARQAEQLGITEEEAEKAFTDPSALGRLTLADEVAAATVLLASSLSAAVTGEDLNVSAGLVTY